MNLALEKDRLELTNYLLIICGISIVLFSINAIFANNDKWGIRDSFQRINFKEYYIFCGVTLFMISLPYLMFDRVPTGIDIGNLPPTKQKIAKLQKASIHGFISFIITTFAYLGYTFIPFLIVFLVSYFFLQ
jgi:hypothetical protein